MKRAYKRILLWSLRLLLGLLLAIILSPALLYVPAIQNFAKDFATKQLSEATGLDISMQHISLRFPLSLSISGVSVLNAPADTMLAADGLSVSIRMLPLLRSEVVVNAASLSGASFRMVSADESLVLSVGVDECNLGYSQLNLEQSSILVSSASLRGGRVHLNLLNGETADSTESDSSSPWLIKAKNIELHDVDYCMHMPPYIDSLSAHVAHARLADGFIDTGRCIVDAGLLSVDNADCRYFYPDTLISNSAGDSLPATESVPWTVTARSLRLTRSHAIYALSQHQPMPGLDLSYIEADSIEVAVDDFYNRGSAIRVPVRHIAARERCGFAIDSAQCTFEMDSSRLAVSRLRISNFGSSLSGEVESNASFNRFSARIDASLSNSDAQLLFPSIGSMMPKGYPASATLSMAAAGTLSRATLTKCLLDIPGVARLSASGHASHLTDPKHFGCDISFSGSTRNLNPLKARLIADTAMIRSIGLPAMSINGHALAHAGAYKGKLALTLASGKLALDAAWNGNTSGYSLNFCASQLPVDAILPTSRIYLLSASGSVEGRGLDIFDNATSLRADISIDTLLYNSNRYYGIALGGNLDKGNFNATLSSANAHCNFSTLAQGHIANQRFAFSVESKIADLDLHALRLMDVASNGSCNISATGDFDLLSKTYDVTAGIENLRWTFDDNFYYTDNILANFVADDSHIDAAISNGDFSLDFDSECSLDTLSAKLANISDIALRQWDDKYINSDSLRGRLPALSCEIELGKRNLVQQYLAHEGISYNRANVMVANDSTFYLRGILDRLSVNDVQIDSLRFGIVEFNHRINWRVRASNAREHIPGFARAELKGYVDGCNIQAQLTQHNFENSTGINVGINAELTDSTVHASLFPSEITIGYKPWTVNDGNFISFNYATKHFDSNLSLTQGSSLFSLTTDHNELSDGNEEENEDIRLKINNVQIADWLSLSPYAPPVKGILAADFSVRYNDVNIWGNGMVGLSDLYYGKHRVGSLRLNSLIDLNPASGGTMATANLEVDGHQCAVAFGALNDTVADNRMTLSLELARFPLSILNPFLQGGDMINLRGYLNGEMTVNGTFDRPNINGYLLCDSTAIAMPVFGSSISLPADSIPVDSSVIRFNDYRIYCLNSNPVITHGSIDLHNPFSPLIDLSMRGNNVQFVDSKQRSNSQIFGKGFLSLDATARGNMENVDLNVRLGLLAGTNLTYILQEDVNSIAARQEQKLVKFVQFNDSSYTLTREARHATESRITLNADISVQQGSSFTVFLSKNGKNRAEIAGNGDLHLSMNHLGDQALTGRFNIDEGFVRYSPPLISQVNFKFVADNYLLWTGDMTNPILNLHAVDSRKANYTGSDSNTRIINFNISLSATNALSNMDVAFDLSTTDDITLQNELQSMSDAQRSSQAINLLLYNTYTGIDSKASSNLSGNPLFSFVTSRINNWAASAMKGITVSFGLDNYTETHDGVSSRAIKYSYQVSKSLFNNRFKIVVGGDYTQGTTSSEEIAQNLFNDVSLEYMLNKNGNMFLRLFNHKGYLNVLEGEVTETGVAFVYKRKLSNLRYLFSIFNPLSYIRKDESSPKPSAK